MKKLVLSFENTVDKVSLLGIEGYDGLVFFLLARGLLRFSDLFAVFVGLFVSVFSLS